MDKQIVVKGVTIEGDFENVQKIRAVGSAIIIKLKNERYFFVRKTEMFDDIKFDTKKDELFHREFFESKISKIYSVSKIGILKNKTVHNLPYLAFLGAGVGLVVAGSVVNSQTLLGIGGAFVGLCAVGKVFDLVKNSIAKKFVGAEFEKYEDDVDLPNFTIEKRNKFETVLVRDE